ncbi:sensor histidine kinase [Hymenobacter sp. B1770]|uniref:sensor histidine kinase n=1 Tax=Hymenobacter sp. B1770 TaxID=1718788 RepID=UPI003CE8E199
MDATFPIAAIAAKKVRFQSLFENSPELIIYQNEAGTILDANPAFLSLVEQSKQQVLYRNYHEFLPPEVQELFRQKLREAFATGQPVRFGMFAAQGHSAPRHWDVVKVPLVENSQVVGVHMLARDITEKVKSQEEMFRQNRDLQQFTCIVSHNLRAPLSNALGLVELLGTEESDSAYFQETHAHLQGNLQHLDQVLRDMNTILALRDQQGLNAPEAVLLADVVQQVVQGLQNLVAQAGGTNEVHIPEGFLVHTNRAYLHSIFFSLLSNAIKYRAEERPLHVVITATENPAAGKTIVVADNGLGFDQERAGANVFQLYRRFHPHHAGRGVELYLVKSHIESMGGRIEVRSQVDEGTRFFIYLP